MSSILDPEKWKTLTLPCLWDNRFSSITVYHRITDNCTGTQWPRRLIVSFGLFLSTFLFWILLHCLDFMLFFKGRDLLSTLWRYSLCFSSPMIFSWLSMFHFEGLWVMIFTSLNLTSEFPDLRALQTGWESEVLNVSPESHSSPTILSFLFLCVLLLRKLLIISFLKLISVLRNFFFKCGNYYFINESWDFGILLCCTGLIFVLFHFV